MADGNSESSLEAGFIELASIVRALHGDWSAPAGSDYDGWTTKDLLAHLSSTEASLARIVVSSTEPPGPSAGPFHPDRWNSSQGRKRKETTKHELLNELAIGTTSQAGARSDMDSEKRANMARSA